MAEAAAADGHALYQHRGTRAVQRMVEFAPSTGGLALWAHHRDLPAEAPPAGPAVPPVATDGHTLFYSAGFDKLPLPEQTGLVAHEVLHVALRHPQRYLELQQLLGDVDLRLFNTCADAIVNSTLSHLTWLRLPASAVMLEKLLASALGVTQAAETVLLEWDVERLYRAIDDRRAPEGGRRGSNQRPQRSGSTQSDARDRGTQEQQKEGEQPSARADGPRSARVRLLGANSPIDLLPSAESQQAPEAEAEAAHEWSERVLRAHAGDGGFSMLRALLADLPRTRTPWQQVLRTQLARALSPRPDVSWSRPARSYLANQGRSGTHRMPWEPGFGATKNVPRLALVVDVSGSIDGKLMDQFAGEIEAMLRRTEAGLVLIIGDDRVQRVEHIESGGTRPGRFKLRDIQFQGGGGTDFTPLLEEADKHRPDIGVVLTDLDGPAHFKPRWPVIWAVPEAFTAAVAPFGRKLTLD